MVLIIDLNSLAVDAKYQRKGIGRMLVQWGIDRAAEEGKDVIIVANPTGSALYQKMGFEEIGKMSLFAGESYEQDEWVYIMRHQD
jgi:predicted N-acetyltransferase YhbS